MSKNNGRISLLGMLEKANKCSYKQMFGLVINEKEHGAKSGTGKSSKIK